MPDERTYGVLVPLVSGPYFGAVLAGIAEAANALGGRSLVVQTLDAALGDDYVGVPDVVEQVGWERMDGLIVVTNAAPGDALQDFSATGRPVVLLSHTVPGLRAPQVAPDNRGGIYEAVAHLVAHGHRHIAFAGSDAQSDLHDRHDAYRAALASHGLIASADLFYTTGNSMVSGGRDAARAMIAAGLPSTAVIAGNDLNAIGIMATLQEAGYVLPRDQAIIGFDDTAPAQYQDPSLTTVTQHVEQVGGRAVALLDEMIRGGQVDAITHVVPSSLVVRGSCGCAPGGARAGGDRAATVHLPPMGRDADAVEPVADALLRVLSRGDGEITDAVIEATHTLAGALVAEAADPAPRAGRAPKATADDDRPAPPMRGPESRESVERSARLLTAVKVIYASQPRGEVAAAVVAILQRAARRLAARRQGGTRNRLDAVVREVALDFGSARATDEMRTSVHLQRVLRAEYDLNMGLLRGRAGPPESLEWLTTSPVEAACLALWTDEGPTGRGLKIVSSFGDVTVDAAPTTPATFPPPALLDAVRRHPGCQAAVLPVKSRENDWGLLAVVGPPESRTLTGRETYFEWSAMLAGSLDYEVMVESLRKQREDLTSAYERERALTESIRASEERYALAAAAANDGLWDWDLDSGTIYYSPRWKSLLGHTEEEIGATPDEWLGRVHRDEQDGLLALIEACCRGEAPDLEHEHRLLAQDGTYRWVLCRALAIPGHGRPASRLVGSLTDITERHDLEDRLRRQALFDTLTGLPNRPLFLDRLDRALARRLRTGTGHFAVVFLDLDGFKLVNDSLGHAAGDALLEQVATRITACLRDSDTAARLGGDEFTVLLEGLATTTAVPSVVRKIQASIAEPYEIDGNTIVVTASAGVATSEVPYGAGDDVLRDADIAMYRAKSLEPGTFVVFDPSMHRSVVSRLQTESRLRRALESDELAMHYQPIVDLASGAAVGMEALIRWPQHDGRILPPGEFLPIAEASALIVPIGRTVVRDVCRQLATWRATARRGTVLPISVNVSHREFWHPELAEHLTASLREHDLPPELIVVEITEGVLMGNVPEALRRLEELHRLGIRLHIDDFGTGYSSLEALHRFPIDALKIDRSFVSRIEADPRSRELVGTIVAMARSLDIGVIAEGIETAEQRRLLHELGCPLGQGYFFSRPVPASAVEEPPGAEARSRVLTDGPRTGLRRRLPDGDGHERRRRRGRMPPFPEAAPTLDDTDRRHRDEERDDRVEKEVVAGDDDHGQRRHRVEHADDPHHPAPRDHDQHDADPQRPAEVHRRHRRVLVRQRGDRFRRRVPPQLELHRGVDVSAARHEPRRGQRVQPVADQRRHRHDQEDGARRRVERGPPPVEPHERDGGHDQVQRRVVVDRRIGEQRRRRDDVVQTLLHVDVEGLLEVEHRARVALRRLRLVRREVPDPRVGQVDAAHEDELPPQLRAPRHPSWPDPTCDGPVVVEGVDGGVDGITATVVGRTGGGVGGNAGTEGGCCPGGVGRLPCERRTGRPLELVGGRDTKSHEHRSTSNTGPRESAPRMNRPSSPRLTPPRTHRDDDAPGRTTQARRDRRPRRPARLGGQAIRTATGAPASIVRDTVQVRSCDACAARGSAWRAASPASPAGNVTSKVTSMSCRRFPTASRTLCASTCTVNASGSLRRAVTASMSAAEHAPIATSSSSTGVNVAPSSPETRSSPPRTLRATNTPGSARSRVIQRWVSVMPTSCPKPASPATGVHERPLHGDGRPTRAPPRDGAGSRAGRPRRRPPVRAARRRPVS